MTPLFVLLCIFNKVHFKHLLSQNWANKPVRLKAKDLKIFSEILREITSSNTNSQNKKHVFTQNILNTDSNMLHGLEACTYRINSGDNKLQSSLNPHNLTFTESEMGPGPKSKSPKFPRSQPQIYLIKFPYN